MSDFEKLHEKHNELVLFMNKTMFLFQSYVDYSEKVISEFKSLKSHSQWFEVDFNHLMKKHFIDPINNGSIKVEPSIQECDLEKDSTHSEVEIKEPSEPKSTTENIKESNKDEEKELTKSQKARARKLAKKKAEKNLKNTINSEIKSESSASGEIPAQQTNERVTVKGEPEEDNTNEINNKKQPKKRKLNQPERFQRVKEDEVDQSLLKKMGKNSFNHKKGASGSFGEQANKDLMRTRGKSFTHEKNKKKRGAYRGGKIDMNSYSIKYDSD